MKIEYEILTYINSCVTPVSNTTLQQRFNVSKRSIINYINKLNAESNNLIRSSNKGYEILNHEEALKLISKANHIKSYDDYNDRKYYVYENIVVNQQNLSIFDIANSLCVSDTTLSKDIVRMNKELKSLNLVIKVKNGYLSIVGEEKNKQRLITKIINKELENKNFSLQSIQKYFYYANINKIKDIVDNVLKENEYNIDDYSLFNYIIHIAVCLETDFKQQSNNTEIKNNYYLSNNFGNHVIRIIDEIYCELKKTFPECNFSKETLIDASVLMSTRAFSTKLMEFDFSQIQKHVGEETKALLLEIISAIDKNYGISLHKNDFVVRFAFHLKNLLIRLREDVVLPTGSFATIKDDYPFMFMIANNMASIISGWVEKPVPESEIYYITLHLGILFDERNEKNRRIRVVIVAYNYLDLGKKIFTKISMQRKNLFLLDIVNSYDMLPRDNIDLIITTQDINSNINIPQIHINSIPTNDELNDINKAIDEIDRRLTNEAIRKKITKLFTNDLFFSNEKISGSENVITFLCNKLYNLDYTEKSFIYDIFAHEAVVPSEYNNVALPHPLTSDSNNINRSIVAVMTFKEPILWKNKNVNLVLLICLKQQDKKLFAEVFKLVSALIANEKAMQKLYDCADINSFIDLLLSENSKQN